MKHHQFQVIAAHLVASAALLAIPAASHASLIVDLRASTGWVTGAVTSNRTGTDTIGDFDGGGTNNDRRNVIAFNTTTPMFTSGQLPVQSGTFYGGKNNTFYGTNATLVGAQNQIFDGGGLGGVDRYVLGSAANPGASFLQTAALVALWNNTDFLNSGATNQVNITSNTAFSVQLGAQAPLTARWLVQIGGIYYVSNENFTTNTTLVGQVINSTGITTTTWAPINLTANGGNLTATPGTYASLTLDNIQSVGVYASYSANSTQNVRWTLEGFSVDALVVPEPSTYAMLLGGIITLLLFRRRRA